MNTAPLLFDRPTLTARRQRIARRAEGSGAGTDLFLHQSALDEVQDRLMMVNRRFTSAAVVTPFPHLWRAAIVQGLLPPQTRVVADDEVLDLAPGAHDLVIHAMALHWANDPVGQLIQCRRALCPDGLLLAVALGGQTLTELRAALGQAETEIAGGLSPRVAPMAEIRDLGALLQRAGLALPVADNLTLTAAYRDLTHLMHDLRAMGETNALSARLRRPTRRGVFDRAQDLYAAHFPADTGGLRATFELVCLTGWAPDDSQPKPLRPGSAQARLADALRSAEIKLTD